MKSTITLSKLKYHKENILTRVKNFVGNSLHKTKLFGVEMKRRINKARGKKTVLMTTGFDAERFTANINNLSHAANAKPARFSSASLAAILVGLVVVLGLGIVLYNVVSANSTSYSVTFEPRLFSNENLPLYVEEDKSSYKFGSVQTVDGLNVPEIKASPISLVWSPANYPLNGSVNVSATMKDSGNWDLSVICNSCDDTNKYQWVPFYRGELLNYQVVKSQPDVNIYAQKPTTDSSNSQTVEDWLKNNIPKGSTVEVLDNSYTITGLQNTDVGYMDNTSTTIAADLRGPHTFYLYLKNKFDLSIVKQDLNWTDGPDAVGVTLNDLTGKLVYQNSIPDDEAIAGGKDQPISKTFTWDYLPYSGIYKLTFTGDSDWLIKSMTVNTNKIVTAGKILPLAPTNLYTETTVDKKVGVYIWHESAVQNIAVTDSEQVRQIFLNKSKLSKEQLIDLTPGQYTISSKGDEYIEGSYFAFDKSNYFDPFQYNFEVLQGEQPDIILSSIYSVSHDGWMTTQIDLSRDRLLQLDNLKKVQLQLRNQDLLNRYNQTNTLVENGYVQLGQLNNYSLWSKQTQLFDNSAQTITDLISKNAHPGSTVSVINNVDSVDVTAFPVQSAPSGFIESDNIITNFDNLSLRGSHDFYVYVNGHIKINLVKQDLNVYAGEDSVDMQLLSLDGSNICTTTLADDGNVTANSVRAAISGSLDCAVPQAGVYLLSVHESDPSNTQGDFLITSLDLNVNKLVIKDKVLSIEPLNLYSNFDLDTKVGFYYWLTGRDQTITAVSADTTNTFDLTESDKSQTKLVQFKKGSYSISIPKGYVIVTGADFAFGQSSWFNPFSIDLLPQNSSGADYEVLGSNYPDQVLIKDFVINAK